MTMQGFVRDDCAMIAAPVQRDVDGISKGTHQALFAFAFAFVFAFAFAFGLFFLRKLS